MPSSKLYKVTRSTVLVDEQGEEHSLIIHTVTARGCNYAEAIEEAKHVMFPNVETSWDTREMTDAEYAEYYSTEGGGAA